MSTEKEYSYIYKFEDGSYYTLSSYEEPSDGDEYVGKIDINSFNDAIYMLATLNPTNREAVDLIKAMTLNPEVLNNLKIFLKEAIDNSILELEMVKEEINEL